MTESVVGLTTHEMIISNASDEEMSDEKSLLAVSVNQSRLGTIDGAAKRTCKTPCQSQGQMRLHSRGGGAVGCVKHGAIVKRKPPQPRHMREAGPIG